MNWQTVTIPDFNAKDKTAVSLIAKRTYEIAPGRIFLATEQAEIHDNDILKDPQNPYYSELLAESDVTPFKPSTDIVVLGNAHAPKGKKAYHLECEVQVGPANKKLVVYGDRKIYSKLMRGLFFTEPVPFEEMEIGYSRAFGGRAKSTDGTLYPFPPNPLGKGFYLKGGFEDYSEIIVPNVEAPESPIDPESLISDKFDDWKNAPKPASFGWTRKSFFPRYTYPGIIPELPGAFGTGLEVNPSLPKIDNRFYQGASDGLCQHNLKGNEHVKLTYLDPDYPVFEFILPGEKPVI